MSCTEHAVLTEFASLTAAETCRVQCRSAHCRSSLCYTN